MSQHAKTDFKHHSKREMDAGLKLHGLDVDTPSQLSDGFRSGAEWAIENKQGKRAPVQGLTGGIPWAIHLEAYEVYCKRWGAQPALIDLEGRGCRGGFSTGELDEWIPGWRARVSEFDMLRKRNVEHEQFRHQHRDCDSMAVENQRLKLTLQKIHSTALTDPPHNTTWVDVAMVLGEVSDIVNYKGA